MGRIDSKNLELARFKAELKRFASGSGFDIAKKDFKFEARILRLSKSWMGFEAGVKYPVVVIPATRTGNKKQQTTLVYSLAEGGFSPFTTLDSKAISNPVKEFEWDGILYGEKIELGDFTGYAPVCL